PTRFIRFGRMSNIFISPDWSAREALLHSIRSRDRATGGSLSFQRSRKKNGSGRERSIGLANRLPCSDRGWAHAADEQSFVWECLLVGSCRINRSPQSSANFSRRRVDQKTRSRSKC